MCRIGAPGRGIRRAPMPFARALAVAAALLAAAACAPAAGARALPRVVIEVPGAIPDRAKLAGRMSVRDGRRVDYRGRIGIERRGQSSQMFPKRSWALETRAARGGDRDVALLGLPADDDWVLYAPYNDKSLMRNVVAYETARGVGRYASRTRFVEVTLNGRYHGVYVLMERLELADRRVALDPPATLLEWTFDYQARRKGTFFRLPVTRRPLLYEDPERADLPRGRRAAVQRSLGAAERALYGRRFRDPARGWRAHLDEAAAIDFALLNELFKNEDAFHASTYLARGRAGRWQLGPVWDFDISMGNSDYGPSSVLAGSMLDRRSWAGRLYRDPALVDAIAHRWRALRAAGLRRQILRSVDRHAARLTRTGAAARNFRRWPVLGTRVWPNPPAATQRTSYAAEVGALRSWLTRRIAWMDAHVHELRPGR
jgi:CotH kinase protein